MPGPSPGTAAALGKNPRLFEFFEMHPLSSLTAVCGQSSMNGANFQSPPVAPRSVVVPSRSNAVDTDVSDLDTPRLHPSRSQNVALATSFAHVAHGAGMANVTPIDSSFQSGARKEREKRRTVKDFDLDETLVKQFVKHSLFPRMKFIVAANALDYSEASNSVCFECLKCCTMLESGDRVAFWNRARGIVKHEMKSRRNSVQTELKDEFLGNLKCV